MRMRMTLLAFVTTIFTVLGLVELVTLVRDRPAPVAVLTATVDGLTANVSEAGWLDMIMPTQDGYQMPASMMPGMPADGSERLSVKLTVANGPGATRPLRMTDEFILRTSKDGKTWKAVGGTFGDLPRLAPQSAVTGVLFFDLPADELTKWTAWMDWSHQGVRTRLRIPLNGAAPVHSHTS